MKLWQWITISVLALTQSLFNTVYTWASEAPNVLFIISDDHASYVTGAYGNKKAKTPNIDRLAKTGVTFTNAFANCPMCTPSRQSFLTGKLPHSIDVTHLRAVLSEETTTLADVMKAKGYTTGAIGKMHFNSNYRHGFDVLLDRKDHRQYLSENPARSIPKNVSVLPNWSPFSTPAVEWLNGRYLPYPAWDDDYDATWFARQADEFMQENKEQPFFLMISFYEPHSPFRFPLEYRDMYNPADFEVPEIGPEDDWQVPDIFRDLTDWQKQQIIASYYTSTAYMDHNVGRVLDALDRHDLDEETLVIYIGDHGYSLGHHGRFEKHTHYEESIKAPLIVRDPLKNRQDEHETELVEFIDIFPTITEFAGVENPTDIEGRSLLPIVRGSGDNGREYVFSEYYHHEEAMVRDHRYKYIYMTGDFRRDDGYEAGRPLPGRTRLLFDLKEDPDEFYNIIDDPDHQERINKMEMEMLRRFRETHPKADQIDRDSPIYDQLDQYLRFDEGREE